jgi:APA family basic amino acid/polyamine antiporter
MIGTGIYLKPGEMAREAGTMELALVAWIIAGLLCLLGVVGYAELATSIPEPGGDYAYLRRGLGPIWAFLYGWRGILLTVPASLAAYGAGIVLLLGFFWPGVQEPIGQWATLGGSPALTLRWSQVLGAGFIILFAGINYLRIRDVGRIQVILTALKTVALLAVIAIAVGFLLGLWSPPPVAEAPIPAGTPPIRQPSVGGFVAAVSASLWAYSGWHQLGRLGGEVRHPGGALPKAMIGGFLFTSVLFLAVIICYFEVLSFPKVAASSHAASDMIQVAAGPQIAVFLTIVMIISVVGTLNANLLTASRVPFAMARDGLFFPSIANVNPERRVPTASVTLMAAMGVLLVLSGTFEDVTALMVFGSWMFHGLTTVALFRLRTKEPNLVRPYRAWGYPIVSGVFVLLAFALSVSILIERPVRSLLGIAVILAGVPFYHYWSRRRPAA